MKSLEAETKIRAVMSTALTPLKAKAFAGTPSTPNYTGAGCGWMGDAIEIDAQSAGMGTGRWNLNEECSIEFIVSCVRTDNRNDMAALKAALARSEEMHTAVCDALLVDPHLTGTATSIRLTKGRVVKYAVENGWMVDIHQFVEVKLRRPSRSV